MIKYLLISFLLLTSTIAFGDPRIHMGIGAGYTEPLQSYFIDKETKSKVTLEGSKYYQAKFGYEFAPGIHIELNGAMHPDHILGIELNNNNGKTTTKISSWNLSANLLYDLNPIAKVRPFFLFGLGTTNIKLNSMQISHSENTKLILFASSQQKNCFTSWNAGLGINFALGNNIDFEIIGKILVINDFIIEYKAIDNSTDKMNDAKMKKTLATAEAMASIKFKF